MLQGTDNISTLELLNYFYFNGSILDKNNIRKCMIELRQNVGGNYKGYIYASSLNEAQKIIIN